LKKLLSPKGLLVANFINDLGFEIPLSEGEVAFQAHFLKVAYVEATYGLNRVLVGGADLDHRQKLEMLSSKWPQPHDQRLWKSIRVHGLKNYS